MRYHPRHAILACPIVFVVAILLTTAPERASSAPPDGGSSKVDNDAGEIISQTDDGAASKTGEDSEESPQSDSQSPAMGVIVGACPGEGVCVLGSLWDSPAHSAGIRAGDYILAINDQSVTSPQQLRSVIAKQQSGDEVRVRVWRKGQTADTRLTLATEAQEPPNSHRAWLGVMLSRSEDDAKGIRIESVHPGSPAEDAGLRVGDRITKLGGEPIESIEDFIEDVRDFGPGSELKLSLIRDGAPELIPVVLGEVDEAPLRWMRYAFRHPMEQFEEEVQSRQRPGVGVMDEVIDDMRRQLKSLQEEMRDLRQDGKASQADEVSDDNAFSPSPQNELATTLVVQRNNDGDRRFGKYGNPNFYDNLRQRNQRQYNRYRFPRYRGIQRPYAQRYYRYGGRPYYYGGRSIYGPRYGLRIGPGFGLYWY